MLEQTLRDPSVEDFQRYPSWRRLVSLFADEISRVTGQHLVAAQTVLVENYWVELERGLSDLGHVVFHVLLHADPATLHERITADRHEPDHVRQWRHEHVETYQGAVGWLTASADLVLDVGVLTPEDAARAIQTALVDRL